MGRLTPAQRSRAREIAGEGSTPNIGPLELGLLILLVLVPVAVVLGVIFLVRRTAPRPEVVGAGAGRCPACGGYLRDGATFCPGCGSRVDLPRFAEHPASAAGAPGIGIAGFICSLLGILLFVLSLIGLILSWVGYRQAVREGRPTGLCMAGVIIGVVWMLLSVAVTIMMVVIQTRF